MVPSQNNFIFVFLINPQNSKYFMSSQILLLHIKCQTFDCVQILHSIKMKLSQILEQLMTYILNSLFPKL